MILKLLSILSLLFLLAQFAFSQTGESGTDFSLNQALVLNHDIQVAYEWLSPEEFRSSSLSSTDIKKVASLHPSNNQIVASKIAFISPFSFDKLSRKALNNANTISRMLNSVGISVKDKDTWFVTNKVRAYGLPFHVTFDFSLMEPEAKTLPEKAVRFFQEATEGMKGTGRERFLSLDMKNFSQLMYRNTSLVYMKELVGGETLVVATVLSAIDLSRANRYFQYPPFSRTESTMIGNLRGQILHMAQELQGN